MTAARYVSIGAALLILVPSGTGAVIEEWVARYDGPASMHDIARAIAVDAGSIYVTGMSTGSDGTHDITTISYSADGSQEWLQRQAGCDIFDCGAWDIAVDGLGGVFVTGSAMGSGGSSDYTTIKYDRDGIMLWVATYDGANGAADHAYALALGDGGAVYVTGSCECGDGSLDCVTVKYDADGNELWAATYAGMEGGDDVGTAVGACGTVVRVAGTTLGLGGSDDYLAIAYDTDGNELWASTYDGPGQGHDQVEDAVLGANASFFVTGWSPGSGGTGYDYATVKYEADGTEEWITRYDGLVSGDDYALAIALDGYGGVVVTGGSWGIPTTARDIATIKYGSDGTELWVARFNWYMASGDNGLAVAVDDAGHIYVAGTVYQGSTGRNYITLKYAAAGDEQWYVTYNGPGPFDDAKAIALGEDGGVFVTGGSDGESGWTRRDYVTIKYTEQTAVEGSFFGVMTEAGSVMLRWTVESLAGIRGYKVLRATSAEGPFRALHDEMIEPVSPGCFEDTAVWAGSTFWYELRAVSNDGSEEVVSGSPACVTTEGTLVLRLYPASPNPFKRTTSFWFDVPGGLRKMNLAVYNARGQLVRKLLDHAVDQGRHEASWDGSDAHGLRLSAGVYFVRLRTEVEERTQKIVLTR